LNPQASGDMFGRPVPNPFAHAMLRQPGSDWGRRGPPPEFGPWSVQPEDEIINDPPRGLFSRDPSTIRFGGGPPGFGPWSVQAYSGHHHKSKPEKEIIKGQTRLFSRDPSTIRFGGGPPAFEGPEPRAFGGFDGPAFGGDPPAFEGPPPFGPPLQRDWSPAM
jgi:hypothetical protein